MADGANFYDRDFFLWTQEQSAALRRAKESNLQLDWENLAEEIESLGKSQRAELNSQIRRILRHLFKLESSPASDPRAGWRATTLDSRTELEDLLENSPSLQREIDSAVGKQLQSAAELATADLEQHQEPTGGIQARLDKGGFSAEQVIGDWFPGTENDVASA